MYNRESGANSLWSKGLIFDVDQPIEYVEQLESLGTVPHYREEASKKDRTSKAVGNQKFSITTGVSLL